MLRVVGAIFEVHADGASFDDFASSLRGIFGTVAVTGLDISGDWDPHSPGDAGDPGQHLETGDILPVRIPERESDPGAGGSDSRESRVFDDASAGHVPDI